MSNKAIWITSAIMFTLLLVAGGVMAFLLMNQPQDTRQKAATPSGTVRFTLNKSTMTLQPNGTDTFQVMINTNGLALSTFSYRLIYPENSGITVTNQVQNPNLQFVSCNFTSPVTGGQQSIGASCATERNSNFSTNTPTAIGTITLKAGAGPTTTPVIVAFDSSHDWGLVLAVDTNDTDIAAIPTGQLSVTVAGGATPTPTPTPTPPPSSETVINVGAAQSCNPNEVKTDIEIRQNNTPKADIPVTFEFNNERKESRTGLDGKAHVIFGLPSQGSYTLVVRPQGHETKQSSVTISACPPATNAPGVVTVQCNQTCNSTRSCASGLSCIGGVCRNTRCSTDQTCTCNESNVASQSGTTQLPASGSVSLTMIMGIIGALLTFGGAQVMVARHLAKSEEDHLQF